MNTFKPEKTGRGWCLRAPDRDVVVDPDGFTVWLGSKAKALAAIPKVTRDEENDWHVLKLDDAS